MLNSKIPDDLVVKATVGFDHYIGVLHNPSAVMLRMLREQGIRFCVVQDFLLVHETQATNPKAFAAQACKLMVDRQYAFAAKS